MDLLNRRDAAKTILTGAIALPFALKSLGASAAENVETMDSLSDDVVLIDNITDYRHPVIDVNDISHIVAFIAEHPSYTYHWSQWLGDAVFTEHSFEFTEKSEGNAYFKVRSRVLGNFETQEWTCGYWTSDIGKFTDIAIVQEDTTKRVTYSLLLFRNDAYELERGSYYNKYIWRGYKD